MDAPKLEVLTGPLKSATFNLPPEGDVSVGREESNLIRIPHSSVSRHHCIFQHRADGSVYVRDVGSRNGTLVNGALIAGERILQPGDEVHVGSSLFVLSPAAARTSSESDLYLSGDGSRFLTGNTVDAAPITAHVVRLLDALLKASVALGTVSTFTGWEQIIFDSVFALTTAERAAILAPDSGVAVSPNLELDGVNKDRTRSTLVIASRLITQSLAGNRSIATRIGSLSVLVSPIVAASRKGALYLEAKLFSEDELHAITAVATLAGLAWERVATLTQLEAENRRLWTGIHHDLIGSSPAINSLIEFIAKVAPAPSNILLLGESGTGKDLVAKAIHRNSPRASKPFITINCGAIPGSLVESELFGAERGAFTGANALRKGLFESANGGTIFLDEISELPLAVQPALLRVLQNREVWRLGGTRAIPLDFRLIAASNRDLTAMIEQGKFRADLFHRLGAVSRTIPPLRDRPDDVPVLAQHFLRKFATRSRPACKGVSKTVLRALALYQWPGNVRELENAIERAVVLGNSLQIELEDLPETIDQNGVFAESGGFHEGVAAAKRQLIQRALDRGDTFVEAARLLKVHPNYLHRLVNILGLRRPPREQQPVGPAGDLSRD